MPLPSVRSGAAQQCHAKSKGTGLQCRNPAAYSMPVCRFHGARRAGTIRRGSNHPQWKHGQETLEAKAERSARLGELRAIESNMVATLMLVGPRWRGRKPGTNPD